MTTTSTDTTLECEAQNENMSTTAKRLVQAAALAAVLVPLGSVAVETAPMTCGFYGGYNGDCASGIGTNEGLTQEYAFGAYKFILSFLSPTGSAFDITISDLHLFDGEFSEREGVSSDTIYQCLPIDPSSTSGPCVEFEVTDSSNGTAWNGYEFTIQWNADTNSLFPNGPGGSVRVLQDPGADPDLFEIDMCVSFGCEYFTMLVDPGISSKDTDFSSFIPVWTEEAPVPEPATLMLLGTGLGIILYRRRRRRHSEPGPMA